MQHQITHSRAVHAPGGAGMQPITPQIDAKSENSAEYGH